MKYKERKVKSTKSKIKAYISKCTGFVCKNTEQSCSLAKHSWLCREKKAVVMPLRLILKILYFFKNIFVLVQLAYFELLYFAHLRLRYIHDVLYKDNRTYKKVNDYKYTRPIRRATILGFVVSFFLFQFMGSFWPEFFNPAHPKVAEGANSSVAWTDQVHFEGSTPPSGAASGATTRNNVDTSSSPGDVKLSSTSSFGNGGDGALTANASFNINTQTNGNGGRIAADGVVTASTGALSAGASTIVVDSATGLAIGDEIFIAKFWKSGTDTTSGINEIRTISNISGTTLTVPALTNSYASKALIQRIPNYTDMTVGASGTITSNAWNGTNATGGVVIFRVSGTLAIASGGKIDTSGLGYASDTGPGKGLYGCDDAEYGQTGPSGAGYGGAGGDGTGPNEYCSQSPGGSTYGNPNAPYDFGSGGGGYDNTSANGGRGGGLIYAFISTINSSGSIVSSGINGNDGGASKHGGGGAGGTVHIMVNTRTALGSVVASGGSGVNAAGGGGGGRIKYVGASDPGSGFTANGGSKGALGTGTQNGSATSPTYTFSAPTYNTSGTINGLKIDAGSGKKAKWSSVSWTGSTPVNTAIKFRTRGADTEGGLASATWSSYYTNSGDVIATSNSQWLEIEATLTTSDGVSTPTLNDFTVAYDTLESPSNSNLALTKTTDASLKTSAGVTVGAGVAGGWTNETSVKVTANGLTCTGCGTSTNIRPEVEVKPIGSAFDGTTNLFAASQGSTVATLTGLTNGTGYHIQVRSIDDQGRVSGWISYGVNVENAADFTVDTISSPAVSTLSASTPAKTSILSWTTVTDPASGVSYYNVYRSSSNGVLGSKVSSDGAVTTGNFAESPADGTYYYTIQAVDNAGNEQNTGNNQFAAVIDNNPPAAFTLASPPDSTWQQSASPTLSWNASSDANGLAKYQLYIDGTLSRDNISSASTSTTPGSALSQGNHTWYIKAVDNAGNITQSNTLNIGYDSTSETPTSLAGTNSYTIKVRVTWSDASTLAPTQEYQIQRVKKSDYDANGWTKDSTWSTGDGYGTFSFPSSTALFDDSISTQTQGQILLEPSVKYAYKIRTVDQAGNTSAWSGVVTGMTMDAVAPTNPSSVTAATCDGISNCSNVANKGYETKLAWTASNDSGTGVTGYKVYRKADTNSVNSSDFAVVGYLDVPTPGAPISTIYYDNDTNNNTTFTDNINDTPNTPIKGSVSPRLNDYVNYHYRITAIDAAGNETSVITTDGMHIPDSTNYSTARTVDVTVPSTPQNVVATPMGLDSSGNAQRVDLTRGASTDITSRDVNVSGSGISGYKVFQCQGNFTTCSNDNNYTQLGTSSSASYMKEGLNEFTQYFYKVIAVDRASSATITDASNNNSAKSTGVSATTASNTVPTVSSSVTVTTKTGNPSTDSAIGHQNTIAFAGSYAKNCSGGERCITGYEIYRSTDNFASNSLKIADVSVSPAGDERGTTYTYVDNNSTNDATSPSISRSSGGSPTVSKAQTAHLSDATTYYYKVKAKDNTPNVPDGGPFVSGLSAVAIGTLHAGWDTTADATAPDVPQNVTVKDIHPNDSMVRNIITWTMIANPTRNGASDFSKYQVYRYETLLGAGTAVLIAEKTDRGDNYHVDGISDAQKDKEYSYYVVALDNAGTDFKYANSQVINTTSNVSDHVAPVSINPGAVNPSVSGIAVASTGVSSATINWTTNQNTDSLVEYRVKNSNDVVAAGKDRTQPTTNHSVSLGSLAKGTAYEYRVISRNSLGNIDSSAAITWREFSTKDFVISNNSISTTTSTATIKWNTNIASDSYVEYKLENSTEKAQVAGDPALVTSHEVTLKSLKPNSRYTYKVRSVTSDKYIAEKDLDTFKTRDNDLDKFSISPAETSVSEQNVTATTAQITWVTTVATTSWVEFGTEPGVYSMSAGDNNFNTLHVVKLTNLVPGTKYYYRVKGKDENGIEVFSPENSLTAILMPEITNLRVREFTSYTATITFDTNVDAVISLNYGKDEGYGSAVTIAKAEKNHVVTLKDLDDNSTYYFQASTTDQFKNNVKSAGSTFSTPLDTQGPEVSELKVDVLPVSDSMDTASVIISWTTDKPSTTLVEYDDKGSGEKYEEQTTEDTSLNTSHTVMIKELNTSSNYRFRIVAKDKRGNLTKTKSSTFITPTKEKSLLQIIIKSLEDTFSWTKNVPSFFGRVGDRLMGK